jgi:hypothetical protein
MDQEKGEKHWWATAKGIILLCTAMIAAVGTLVTVIDRFSEPKDPPVINFFKPYNTPFLGENVSLGWGVENANTVIILQGGPGIVSRQEKVDTKADFYSAALAGTTDFTLKAINQHGTVSMKITVTPLPWPALQDPGFIKK